MEAVLTTVTLHFGWRAVRQSCHVMDRVVRCEERLPSWRSLKTTRLKPWGEATGMSNNLSAAMAAALITRTRGEVATLVRRILSVSPGDGLQAWFAVAHWFKPRSVVEQAASMARLISPKLTKNVNELQVAVMQWELTLLSTSQSQQRWLLTA